MRVSDWHIIICAYPETQAFTPIPRIASEGVRHGLKQSQLHVCKFQLRPNKR